VNESEGEVQRAFEALLIKARAEGRHAPTVAGVAARAGISRSSMYRFHAEVVARIQGLSAPQRTARQGALHAKVRLLTQQLEAQRELTKALAQACAELAAEKVALNEQLEEERLRFGLRLESVQKTSRGVKAFRVVR
jgi:AcrR family transcriptional regulator